MPAPQDNNSHNNNRYGQKQRRHSRFKDRIRRSAPRIQRSQLKPPTRYLCEVEAHRAPLTRHHRKGGQRTADLGRSRADRRVKVRGMARVMKTGFSFTLVTPSPPDNSWQGDEGEGITYNLSLPPIPVHLGGSGKRDKGRRSLQPLHPVTPKGSDDPVDVNLVGATRQRPPSMVTGQPIYRATR